MIKTFSPTDQDKLSETIYKTSLAGVLLVKPPLFKDDRGFFKQMCVISELEKVTGVPFKIAQINHARTNPKVIKGFHAEGWNKLVTVVTGECISVIIDLRPDSPTFGQHQAFLLGESEQTALYLPVGVGNSVCVTSQIPMEYLYFVDKEYANRDKTNDRAISIFDEHLNIDWPIENPIISDRDKNGIKLKEMFPEKFS